MTKKRTKTSSTKRQKAVPPSPPSGSATALPSRELLPPDWTADTLINAAGLGDREPGRSNWLRPVRLIPLARRAALSALADWSPGPEVRRQVSRAAALVARNGGGRLDAPDSERVAARFALGQALLEVAAIRDHAGPVVRAWAALLAVADHEAMREEARLCGEDASVMPRPSLSIRHRLEFVLRDRLERLPLDDRDRQFARRVRDGEWVRDTGNWDTIGELEAKVTSALSDLLDTTVVTSTGKISVLEDQHALTVQVKGDGAISVLEDQHVLTVQVREDGAIWLNGKATSDYAGDGRGRRRPLTQASGVGALLLALTDEKALAKINVSSSAFNKLRAYLGSRCGVRLSRDSEGRVGAKRVGGGSVRFQLLSEEP